MEGDEDGEIHEKGLVEKHVKSGGDAVIAVSAEAATNLRTRRRVSLGLSGVESLESSAANEAKYSQGEVDALVEKKMAEAETEHQREMAEVKAESESQMMVMQTALTKALSDADEGKGAEADRSLLQQELNALLERQEEFESSKMAALSEAERELGGARVHLSAMTTHVQTVQEAREEGEKRIQSLEGELARQKQELEASQKELAKIRDEARDGQDAAVLKMKSDMKALAEKQFAEANKVFRGVKGQLKHAKEEAAEAKKTAEDKTKRYEDELKELQAEVGSLKKRLRDSEAGHEEVKQQVVFLKGEQARLAEGAEGSHEQVAGLKKDLAKAATAEHEAMLSLAAMTMQKDKLVREVADLTREVADLTAISNELMEMQENSK